MKTKEILNLNNWVGMFFLGLFLSACSTEQANYETSTIQISKALSIDQSRVVKNSCFTTSFIIDDFVIFIAECDSNYFHVYDKNTLDFKLKFGTKGRAPSEFFYPFPFLTNKTRLPKDEYYYFYDLNLLQTKKINFNRILEGYVDKSVISSEHMDRELYFSNCWNQLDDQRIAAVDISDPEGLFFIYNTEKEKKNWIKYLHSFDMDDKYNLPVFRGKLISNGEIIIFASRYFDEILIFDNQGKLLKKSHFSPVQMPKLSTQFTGVVHETPVFFFETYGNIDACYLSRLAMPIQEIDLSLQPTTQLFEMDWDGELMNVYEMDFIPRGFSVCESTHKLYAVLANELENDSITMIKVSIK